MKVRANKDPKVAVAPLGSQRVQAMKNQSKPGIILVLPFDDNPYQESLYTPMRAAHPSDLEIVYWYWRRWVGLPSFFALAAITALRGGRVAHLHWLHFNIDRRFPFAKTISSWTTRTAIWWLVLLRYRIIWTVHNLTPHEPQTHDDLAIAQIISRRASAIIVHSPSIRDRLTEQHIPTERVIVIPQGSYLDAYSTPPNRDVACRKLGVDPTQRIVLFFGLIRSYKGVAELIACWDERPRGATLYIVGRHLDGLSEPDLQRTNASGGGIEFRLGRVPEEDVPLWFAVADVGCFPFTRVTTSSSAVLALSLGVPIIAPRLGTLVDLPDDVGYFYDPSDANGLGRAIDEALSASDATLATHSAAGVRYAESTSWPAIAETTFALYCRVFEEPMPKLPTRRGRQ